MDALRLAAPFERIGARAKTTVVPMLGADRLVQLDIRHDARGSFYEVLALPQVSVRVVDVRPDMRHLLLLAHNQETRVKHKFLCGHDERHWFVAAVPGAWAADVRTAMEALKPLPVRRHQEDMHVTHADRVRRRNAAFIRQGEWFFIRPTPQTAAWLANLAEDIVVLRNEPLSRGGRSRPHVVQEAFRTGGEFVNVSRRFPAGLTDAEHAKTLASQPELRRLAWWRARRNPTVFARGTVRHPDHATISLDGWHQVLMNEEGKSDAARHVVFID